MATLQIQFPALVYLLVTDWKYLPVVVIVGLWTSNKGAYEVPKNKEKTVCPKCHADFSIAENRTHQIRRKYAPFWFIDAIRQFENFREVTCPLCGYIYEAEEARLFLFFKSPYAVFILALVIALIAILINLKLLGKF